MKLLLATLDLKAEFFGNPFTARTEGEAIRVFTDGVNDPQTQLHQHPEDFALYVLGNFNEQTGVINAEQTPRLLIAGSAVERR